MSTSVGQELQAVIVPQKTAGEVLTAGLEEITRVAVVEHRMCVQYLTYLHV